jgi:hypothetical protein
MTRVRRLITTVVLCTISLPHYSVAYNTSLRITADNIHEVAFGYALPGYCGSFSPNSSLMANQHGIHEIETGQKVFNFPGSSLDNVMFSPDGRYIVIAKRHIYDVATQEMVIEFDSTVTFSPDGRFVMEYDGIYEVGTWREVLTNLEKTSSDHKIRGVFSPDSRYFARAANGLYETQTGAQIFASASSYVVFSPDSRLVAFNGDGLYETATGQRRFDLPEIDFKDAHISGFSGIGFNADSTFVTWGEKGSYNVVTGDQPFDLSGVTYFSPDGQVMLVAVDDHWNGFDAVTGEKLFVLNSFRGPVHFIPDTHWVLIEFNGVYDAHNGTLHFPLTGLNHFNTAGDLLMHDSGKGSAIYNVATAEKVFNGWGAQSFSPDETLFVVSSFNSCSLFSLPDRPLPHSTGLIRTLTSSVNIRTRTDINSQVINAGQGELVVVERMLDNSWFKVNTGYDIGWVSATAVEVLYMPDEVPILD